MKLLVFIAVLACAFQVYAEEEEVQKEDGVLVLTTANFKGVIEQNEHILVEFYAPWCGHCKALAPEYAAAATLLKDEQSVIKLAKVDATVENGLAEEFQVRGYPTLKFFTSGTPIDYSGGRTAKEIVQWLKKKTGPPAKDLSSVDDAKAFVESQDVVVIGFFKDQDTDAAKEFLGAARALDDTSFGITSDEAVMKEYNVEGDKVVLFKKFDEGRNDLDDITKDSVKKFVTMNSLPLVVEFNHDTAPKIFGGEVKSHLLIFASKSGADFEKIREAAAAVAKEFKGQLLFVTIDTDEEDHQRILEFFGMKKENVPGMRIIKLQEEMSKYKPDAEDLSEDGMRSFVQSYVDGKLKVHLLSQDIPEDWDKEHVKILVSKNFDEVALDKSKNVLVMFHAPWCGHCKQLAPIYDQLGEKYKDQDDVLIAKIDATANELEHTKIQSFPTIKLWKKDTNEVGEYNGERTLNGLSKFLETGGEYGMAAPDEDEDYDEEEDVDEDSEEDVDHKKDEL
uniref:Protein disulfide-isomerase n=1 Tax=Vargula hilgendorfii TaxID=6674 RepID=A0A2Z5WPU1_VARHI|nr:protein disulfide isomerase [Vargula hilgendorfii]